MVKRVFVLISFVVAILVIVGNAFAQDKTSKSSIPEPSLGPEWKFVATSSDGTTTYVNTRSIRYLRGAIVKVWTLWVPRGGTRRGVVDNLKHDLTFKGEDPNDAERVWYYIQLAKVNCKKRQIAILEEIDYSFVKVVLNYGSAQHEKWYYIPPGTVAEKIEKFVCKERK